MSIPSDRRRSAYHYDLDPARIAQTPVTPRDAARLLVHDRASGTTAHHRFRDLDELLRAGDLLVVNTTRVLPARLHPRRAETGATVEILLLRARTASEWEALVRPGKRLKPGAEVLWGDGTRATIAERLVEPEGARLVRFSREIAPDWLARFGAMPLPPYIRRPATEADAAEYQTVYASAPGAVAAPTAGLHFTPALLDRLAAAGIERADIVLHVGAGTFRPVHAEDIAEHPMHREYFEVPAETLGKIRRTRERGGRIVAVGTTAVRTLETLAIEGKADSTEPVCGWTGIFLYPPYAFRLTDAMITNFHLPESTLIMLVSAFAGRERTLALYREAISFGPERDAGYRFFSYGDAMLIT